MTWIRTIPYGEASGRLKSLYDRVKAPGGNVDNVMLAHGLRPHSMEGHMKLYKSVLHHSANSLPKWFLEALGTYASHLNGCAYCVDHHFAGLTRLLGDESRAEAIGVALTSDAPERCFDGKELAFMRYAKAITVTPTSVDEMAIQAMRDAGADDGEILEVNQVVCYFAYVNRMVLTLGVDTEGDILGLSPGNSDDPNDWSHG